MPINHYPNMQPLAFAYPDVGEDGNICGIQLQPIVMWRVVELEAHLVFTGNVIVQPMAANEFYDVDEPGRIETEDEVIFNTVTRQWFHPDYGIGTDEAELIAFFREQDRRQFPIK